MMMMMMMYCPGCGQGGSFVGTPWPEIGDARTSSGRFDDSLSANCNPLQSNPNARVISFLWFLGAWPAAKKESLANCDNYTLIV